MPDKARPVASRLRFSVVVSALAVVALLAGTSQASHWFNEGWRDDHVGYPARPDSLTSLNSTFGTRCIADSQAIRNTWYGYTTDGNLTAFSPRYHRKLGGRATAFYASQGGTSTNLDNDVQGHIYNNHLDSTLKGGIWGYVCKQITDSSKWSVHSWGAALDIHASY